MKSDAEIRDDVINELYWDPQVTEPEASGVAVRDGAVTLTGHVPSLPDSGPADIPRPASPVPRPSSELAGLMMCGPRPPASMGRCAAEAKRRARQRRR